MDAITSYRNYVILNGENDPMCVIDTKNLTPQEVTSKIQEALNDEFDADVKILNITDVEYGFMYRIDVEVQREEDEEPFKEQLTMTSIAIY